MSGEFEKNYFSKRYLAGSILQRYPESHNNDNTRNNKKKSHKLK